MRSKGFRRALTQLIRALRTGGSLSDIITLIADDVAYELRMKMKEFGERLNLIGVLFMFICVVFPVMIGVMTPVSSLLGSLIPLEIVFLFYFILAPMLSGMIVYMIKLMEPS